MIRSKKLVSMALCLALTATVFSGCGKKGSGNSGGSADADYDHIYREEEFPLSEEVKADYLYNMYSSGDRIIAYGDTYDANGSSSYDIVSFNKDGSDVKQFSIKGSSDGEEGGLYLQGVKADEEGNVYAVKNEYSYTEEESFDSYYLEKYTSDGELIWSVDLADKDGDTTYQGLFYLEGKGLLLYGDSILKLYSKDDGSLINKFDTGLEYFMEIVPKDDKVLLSFWEDESYKLKEYNLTEGKMGGDVEFPGSMMNYNYCLPGSYSDLLLVANSGIYTYNIGDAEVTYNCSYIDSDIDPDTVNGVVQLSETEFLLLVMEEESGTPKFKKIVKVPAEEAKSREIITLGCYWMDSTVRSAVIDFNKTNTKYRISVKDYSMYDTDNDYSAGVTRLNTDIVGGNIPDIILSSYNMPMESYAAKGLFMDLDPLIEGDADLNMDDYLVNIIDSFRRDGKLYSLVPGFSVYTVATATSNLGGKTSWTIKEMMQIADSKGIAYKDMFGPYYRREDLITMAVYLNASSYIDWDNHQCNFDSDEFKEFLAFLKEFPEKIDDSVYSDDTSGYWRSGKALVDLMYMSSFDEYQSEVRGTFGESVTLVGFPTAGKSGSAIIPSNEFCISATTTKKDGCWEFLKCFFTDEFQEKIVEYNEFPVKRSTFEKMADDSMKADTWINEDGEEESYTGTTYIDGEEVELTPLTQEERDYVVGFIESLTEHVEYDEEILNIITEEAAAYFGNQKSVDDVAKIIQSRISIYVNENG